MYISIGNTCGVSRHIDGPTHIFDYFKLLKLTKVNELLKNNFKNLLNDLTFVKYSNEFFNDKNKPSALFKCKKYNLTFYHDFTSEDLSELPEVKIKYQRRIDRFYETIRANKNITFIRDDNYSKININHIKEFIKLVKEINLDSIIKIIVIVNNPQNFDITFEKIEGVFYYNDTEPYIDWKRDNLDWNVILNI